MGTCNFSKQICFSTNHKILVFNFVEPFRNNWSWINPYQYILWYYTFPCMQRMINRTNYLCTIVLLKLQIRIVFWKIIRLFDRIIILLNIYFINNTVATFEGSFSSNLIVIFLFMMLNDKKEFYELLKWGNLYKDGFIGFDIILIYIIIRQLNLKSVQSKKNDDISLL